MLLNKTIESANSNGTLQTDSGLPNSSITNIKEQNRFFLRKQQRQKSIQFKNDTQLESWKNFYNKV
jgi:hypothetical protein